MSNVYTMDGGLYKTPEMIMEDVLKANPQHVVVIALDSNDNSHVFYDRQRIYELVMASKVLQVLVDDIVSGRVPPMQECNCGED